jgi:NAD(P)-dependent dehydrogenase (short-subunit alcohol dehydrogenase family)
MRKTTQRNSVIPDGVLWAAAAAGLLITGNAIYQEINKYKLEGKVVLVTGGSRGLGLVLSRLLAAKKARLAICARSTEHISKAVHELRELGADVIGITADLTDISEVKNVINEVITHYGRLDVLINNAGIVQVGPMETMTIEDYENAMRTNFWAPLYAIYSALPHFRSQGEGRIVNVTSIGGKIAVPHLLPYTASKFALTGLSEGLHAELKKYNIHVTTIVPHLMRTGSPRNITVKGDHEAEYAWFKLSDSSPLLSQDVETAAKKIIRALEYGDSESILALTAKVATVAKGIVPGWVSAILSLADKFLPENKEGGSVAKKGYEAESPKSRGRVAALTDKAALQNNEM